MVNPLSGIISQKFKQTFKNAIDALLENTALALPCTIVYGGTKFTQCDNCLVNVSTGLSLNKYNGTGPKPFTVGLCPVCFGKSKIEEITKETLYLGVVYDIKKWVHISSIKNIPDGTVQTICSIEYLTKLQNAQYIIINSDIENYLRNKFVKFGDPQPYGLGEDAYVGFLWKKAE